MNRLSWKYAVVGFVVIVGFFATAPQARAADYTVTLTATQETALSEATEQVNLRAGILYATGATVTNGSATVTLKSAATDWRGKWLKVAGDTAYYKITSVVVGTSATVAPAYAGATGTGKDVTLHLDDGATPTSAAIPDKTKAQALQAIADADLVNALRNLDARITPVLVNLKALDAATQALVVATDPSPATRTRAVELAK